MPDRDCVKFVVATVDGIPKIFFGEWMHGKHSHHQLAQKHNLRDEDDVRSGYADMRRGRIFRTHPNSYPSYDPQVVRQALKVIFPETAEDWIVESPLA